MAAKYYRLAEENGNKIVGNFWYVFFQSNPSLLYTSVHPFKPEETPQIAA